MCEHAVLDPLVTSSWPLWYWICVASWPTHAWYPHLGQEPRRISLIWNLTTSPTTFLTSAKTTHTKHGAST